MEIEIYIYIIIGFIYFCIWQTWFDKHYEYVKRKKVRFS